MGVVTGTGFDAGVTIGGGGGGVATLGLRLQDHGIRAIPNMETDAIFPIFEIINLMLIENTIDSIGV